MIKSGLHADIGDIYNENAEENKEGPKKNLAEAETSHMSDEDTTSS